MGSDFWINDTGKKLKVWFKHQALLHCEMGSHFLSIDTMLHIFYGDIRYLMYCLNFSCVKISEYTLKFLFCWKWTFLSLFSFCLTKNSQQLHGLMGWHFILKTCQGAVKLINHQLYFLRWKLTQYYRNNCQVPNSVHCLSHLWWLIIYLSSKHSFSALLTALQ